MSVNTADAETKTTVTTRFELVMNNTQESIEPRLRPYSVRRLRFITMAKIPRSAHCENCLRALTAKICHLSRLFGLYSQ